MIGISRRLRFMEDSFHAAAKMLGSKALNGTLRVCVKGCNGVTANLMGFAHVAAQCHAAIDGGAAPA